MTNETAVPDVTTSKDRRLIHVQATNMDSTQLTDLVGLVMSCLQSGETIQAISTNLNVQIFSLPLGDLEVPPLQVVGAVNPALIAKVARDTNVAYTRALGDNSVIPWADDTEENKMALVRAVLHRLRFRLSAEQQHEAWAASKVADGWSYGPVKDAEAKTHPQLVAYADLSPEQKMKDYLFGAIVDSMFSNLPVPQSENLRPVQRAGAALGEDGRNHVTYENCSFLDIKMGNLFRFADDPTGHVWVATSDVFINYTDSHAVWSVDSTPYDMTNIDAQLNGGVAADHEVQNVVEQTTVTDTAPAADFTGDDA
jgi:hypothetical protein